MNENHNAVNGRFESGGVERVQGWIRKCNADMEYAGGFTDYDSPVLLRCRKCGNIFQRSMISIRHGRKTICKTCQQLNAEAKQKAHEQDVLKRKAERHDQALERARADAKSRREARRHNCPVCGASTTRRKYCSNECCIKANKYIYDPEQSALHEARRRVRMSSQIKDRGISLKKLYERDEGTCWICGMACEYSDSWHKGKTFIAGNLYPSIDHIVPLSRGGAHAWNNVKLAHRICNTKRFYSSPG